MHLISATLLAITLTVSSKLYHDGIFNKTWFSSAEFAGVQYVFYKLENGGAKVIKQVLGSGVCSIKSEIFDLEIKSDTLKLFNGLDLKSGEPTLSENLLYSSTKNELYDEKGQLRVRSKIVEIFNWATNEMCDMVDFERLKKLRLSENEIYDLKIIKELRIKEGKPAGNGK